MTIVDKLDEVRTPLEFAQVIPQEEVCRVRYRLAIILFVLMACGCGSGRLPTYPVSGKVAFADGKVVKSGTIELESIEHGVTATGAIRQDGTFVLGTYTEDDGAVEGEHRAIIVQIIIADGNMKHTIDHGRATPTRYASYETSPLKLVVKDVEKNDLQVVLDAQ